MACIYKIDGHHSKEFLQHFGILMLSSKAEKDPAWLTIYIETETQSKQVNEHYLGFIRVVILGGIHKLLGSYCFRAKQIKASVSLIIHSETETNRTHMK